MISALFETMAILFAYTAVGFLVFRPQWSQKNLLPPFIKVVLDFLYPLYFVFRIPAGWGSATTLGWSFLVGMFLLALSSMAIQGWLATRAVAIRRDWITRPSAFILLAALHNAGFIPLPILERLVPDPIIVGMSFYFLAFNLVVWTFAVSVIKSGHMGLRHFKLRLSPALVGLTIGILVSATGLYRFIPDSILHTGRRIGEFGLDLALVALGGALAGIREKIHMRREHWYFVGWRMILFPLVVLGIASLPLPIFAGPFGWGFRLVLVLEAVVPPATLVLVVTKAYGKPEQIHYTGEMMLITYAVSMVTIPLFVAVSVLLFLP